MKTKPSVEVYLNDMQGILELARRALADADIYEDFANAYDLSDEQVKELQDNIHKCTKGF